MKIYTRTVLFILLTILSLGHTSVLAQNNKRAPNISLNINSGKSDSLKTTCLNIGLLTNIRQLKGVGINVFSGITQTNAYGLQASGLVSITKHSMKGVQIGGLSTINGFRISGIALSGLVNISGYQASGMVLSGGINIFGNNARGLAFGGLFNIGGRDMSGVTLSGLGNIYGNNTRGVALASLLNITGEDLYGAQLSGLLNVSGRESYGLQLSGVGNVGVNVSGAQLSAVSNIVSDTLTGMQLCAAVNVAMNTDKALQMAGLTNICLKKMHGTQIALGNYATQVKGAQIGLLNLCGGEVKGVQIGLINHSKDTSTVKIGLVNVNPRTRIQMLAWGGNATKFNLAARFRNKMIYTLLGFGTHYLDLNEKFSGAIFYRAGLYFPLVKKLSLSGDLGYAHIENFENKNDDTPQRMYALQARINLEYQAWKKIGFFASAGYGITRYYNQNKMFDKKPIIEAGIVLF